MKKSSCYLDVGDEDHVDEEERGEVKDKDEEKRGEVKDEDEKG